MPAGCVIIGEQEGVETMADLQSIVAAAKVRSDARAAELVAERKAEVEAVQAAQVDRKFEQLETALWKLLDAADRNAS